MSSKNEQAELPVRDPRRWSISRRLALIYSASSLVMLVLATGYFYWSLVDNLSEDDNAFLANKIQECRRLLRVHPNKELLAHEIQVEAAASQFIKYYIRLLDDKGRVVIETPGMHHLAFPFPPPTAAADAPTRGTVRKTPAGDSYLVMAAQAQLHGDSRPSATVHVALDVSADDAVLARYRRTLPAVLVLGVFLSCLTGLLVARKGLQPLKDIVKTTDRISVSQLHERIAANRWPDELLSLADSFDGMMNRLEDSFKRLSQFSGDLAHEIRTPINNLRGETGVALSQPRTAEEYRLTLESNLEEYARLSRLVEILLFLARADRSAPICPTLCEAQKSIEKVREFYQALADDRGIEIICQGMATFQVDPLLFEQAVSNLLSNALNHTPQGGKVFIMVQQTDGNGAEVNVTDTGSGIAAEHLPHIFDRFYRVDPARSHLPNGYGLGLAIVKSIMALHGGSVEVQSELGKGTAFVLRFPSLNLRTER
jgi:two-component system, OmpR family, heavy metal sensor histidine kinase CusS